MCIAKKSLQLAISGVTSADLPDDYWVIDLDSPDGYEAQNRHDVIFQVSFDVGPVSSLGRDLFECVVLTPNHLHRFAHPRHGLIVLEEYTYGAFRDRLKGVIRACEAPSWYECLKNLRRHFRWEYEGMYSEAELEALNS
ncbi:Imm8 family immunity protein [Rhizobium sp. WYJ-E13]|uniref:Imm8 family immunity protein n=1 Tax=unclassified Rhizobium TaxID=2613769 RepID=UPI001C1ED52E|nr:Imm8 family immunity protein [Rhizobium sp. WYJ-E13]QWW69907.1 immunity 8 family protein [Rhizobium sp. WYJ-E13]